MPLCISEKASAFTRKSENAFLPITIGYRSGERRSKRKKNEQILLDKKNDKSKNYDVLKPSSFPQYISILRRHGYWNSHFPRNCQIGSPSDSGRTAVCSLHLYDGRFPLSLDKDEEPISGISDVKAPINQR